MSDKETKKYCRIARIVTAQLALILTGSLSADRISVAEVPLEIYGQPDTFTSMAISPTGDRIAFRRRDEDTDAVFVVDIKTGDILGAVDGSETKLRRVRFVDQNRILLMAEEAVQTNFRYTNVKRQNSASFVLDLKTNQLTGLLKNSHRLYPLQSGVGRVVGYDAEADAFYMPAYIGELDGPPATYGLLEVTLQNPAGRLLERGGEDTVDWIVDTHGHILAEEEYDAGKNRWRIWGHGAKRRVLLFESSGQGPSYNVVGFRDNPQSLIVSAIDVETDHLSIFEMNLKDGGVKGPLFQRDDVSIEKALVDHRGRVYGVEFAGFLPTYAFFDPTVTERVQAIQGGLENTAAYLVDWTPDLKTLLFRISGGWTSGAYVIVGPDSAKPRIVAAIREEIPRDAVAPTQIIRYPARDGLEIPALVTARDDVRSRGKAPLIVMPHDGPASHDRYGFDWMVQYFASRGFVVLQPQFRGSDGFGASLRNAGEAPWSAAITTDLDDGVLSLINAGLVDPDRVCVAGSGYGGYAALTSGSFSPFNYKCLVSIAGFSDLTRWMVTTADKYGEHSNTFEYWERQFGDNGRTGGLEDISPVNFAKNFHAPVLLIHGSDDAVVPLDQSLRMQKALKRANKKVELVRLKREDHYLSGYETRLQALTAIADFIDQNL